MQSKGQQTIGNSKGAERKALHGGQFWTPQKLAWRIHELCNLNSLEPLSILDNSAGIGRLLEGLGNHNCHGIEIDSEAVHHLQENIPYIHSYEGDFLNYHCENFDLAILNPPFNLTMDSRLIRTLGIGGAGELGPGTRALSQYVSLALALEAAGVVIAIIPNGALDRRTKGAKRFLLKYGQRLSAIIELPEKTFKEEGTSVPTQLAIFLPEGDSEEPLTKSFDKCDYLFEPVVTALEEAPRQRPEVKCVNNAAWVQTLPEQGDNRLTLKRNGRHLMLVPDSQESYFKAMDSIAGRLVAKGGSKRWPYDDRSRGFGMNLHAYLVQDNPQAAFDDMLDELRENGLNVTVSRDLIQWFRRRVNRNRLDMVPFRHWVRLNGRQQLRYWLERQTFPLKGRFRHDQPLYNLGGKDGKDRAGKFVMPFTQAFLDEMRATSKDTEFTITKYQDNYWAELDDINRGPFRLDELVHYFSFDGGPDSGTNEDWQLLHPGIEPVAPDLYNNLLTQAKRKGIDQYLYNFSFQDLIELASHTSGIYNAKMGLAKTRMGIALIKLIAPKHGLIAFKRRHLREFLEEYEKLGFPQSELNVIESGDDLKELKPINVISYDKLKLKVKGINRRNGNTFADLLRRRCSVVICDEAHVLSNPDSLRSGAVERIQPKRIYLLTGQAMRGYARNIHNLGRLVAGDGTVRNPYGKHVPYMEPLILHGIAAAQSATKTFAEHFVEVRNASAQFTQTLSTGMRFGETPRIKDIHRFRKYVDPLILRRLDTEPEVIKEIPHKEVEKEDIYITPDQEHLLGYYAIVGSVVDWLEKELKEHGKIRSYVEAKKRLAALHWAASFPMGTKSKVNYPHKLTQLQQRMLADLDKLMGETNDKIIIVAENPEQVEFLGQQARSRGHAVQIIHGKINIDERDSRIYDHFRDGEDRVLFASAEVVHEGYNLHCANHVWHIDGYWESIIKNQTNARITRPQQTKRCYVRNYILAGMLPEYKEMLSRLKDAAIAEGIDYDETVEDWEMPSIGEVFAKLAEDYRTAQATNREPEQVQIELAI